MGIGLNRIRKNGIGVFVADGMCIYRFLRIPHTHIPTLSLTLHLLFPSEVRDDLWKDGWSNVTKNTSSTANVFFLALPRLQFC